MGVPETRMRGLDGDSMCTRRVFGEIAAFTASKSEVSTNLTVTPHRFDTFVKRRYIPFKEIHALVGQPSNARNSTELVLTSIQIVTRNNLFARLLQNL
mgnify:FL=1